MKKKILCFLIVLTFLTMTSIPEATHLNFSRKQILKSINQQSLNSLLPDNFNLSLVCGGVPPWSTLYYLSINSVGNASYKKMYPINRSTTEWTPISQFTVTENEMNTLWNTILDNNFFNLNSSYDKGVIEGGTFANLTITALNESYSVQTENIDISGFDNIVKELNMLTPGEYDVYYNALINSPPLRPSTPYGPLNVSKGELITYSSSTFDFDDDQVYYMWDWGDGTFSEWIGPFENDENSSISHQWSKKSDYSIRVKAIDDPDGDGNFSDGCESEWSDTLPISVPKSNQYLFNSVPFVKSLVASFPLLSVVLYDTTHFFQLKPTPQSMLDDIKLGTEVVPDPDDSCKFTIRIRICLVGTWIDKQDGKPGGAIDLLHGRIKQEFESRWNRDQWDKTGGPDGKPDGNPDGEPPWRVPCEVYCDPWEPGCIIHFDIEVTAEQHCSKENKTKLQKSGYHVININDPPPELSTVNGLDHNHDGETDDLPDPNEIFGDHGSTTGDWAYNAAPGVFAHECGHLLGLFDQYTVSYPDTNHNGKKDPNERRTTPKDGKKGNIMAETDGYPSQEDIEEIWRNSLVECPCTCCPKEQEDTKEPENNILSPKDGEHVSSSLIVTGIANDGNDGSGVAILSYSLHWEGHSYNGQELQINPPRQIVEYTLGPLYLENYIEPGDWITITTYATDAAGNTGDDSITVVWIDEEDTIPPVTEKIIGEPNEENGYVIWTYTPIWLNAVDEGGSGVDYIHYEIAWDMNSDGIYDEFFIETIYQDSVEFHMQDFGILHGLIELQWYAVDKAENVENIHFQSHQIMD